MPPLPENATKYVKSTFKYLNLYRKANQQIGIVERQRNIDCQKAKFGLTNGLQKRQQIVVICGLY